MEKLRTICAAAIKHFGFTKQRLKAVEEMAELTAELARQACDPQPESQAAIIGEIADVYIMLTQLGMMYGAELVQAEVDAKLERLHGRIAMERGQ